MRDKVKRFISILMTALMLVNLLPVGALAEGMKLDSNSVQSRASKKSANVYVYVKVTGDKAGLTINQSGWYTIGKSENVPGMGTPYWYMHGSHSFSDVGVSYKTVLKTNFTRWTDNQKIDLDQITWTEFYVDNGADDYVKAGTYTWHMNGTIDIKQLPSVYTIKYVDYDTKELIHSYEESGLMGQTPKKITAPDSWQENLYSFYFVNGHPKEQTVDFKKDKGELTFYYKKNTANYTVNYYLNGTTTKVAAPKKGTAALGSSVTESPITVDGYTPVSGDSKKITIKANSDENVINFYYYKNVTLTANSKTETYDGNEHSVSGFTGAPKGVTFVGITEPSAMGTDAGKYPANFADGTVGKVDATGKYIVTKAINGKLEITPNTDKVTVTITENSGSVKYDGNEHTVTGYKSITADNTLYDVATSVQETPTEAWTAKGTNVGEYPVGIESKDFKNTNANFSNVEFVVVDGKLEITPNTDKVVVTITENSASVTYDGKEHTVTGYKSMTADNTLYNVATSVQETPTEAWTAKGTNVGEYPVGIESKDFKNTNANFSNVEFVVVDGKLEITPNTDKVTVTITENSGSVKYDGNEHTVTGYKSITADNPLYDVSASVEETPTEAWTAKGTDVGEYPVGIAAGDFKNTNETFTNVEFVVVDGTLKITPVTDKVVVTITENSASVAYDGKEHTVTGYKSMTADNPLYDVSASVEETPTEAWTAKGTDVGEYPVGIESKDFKNTNANFSNVEFVVVDGKLEITPVTDKVTVTITEKSDTVKYDGNEHTVTGYKSMTADNPLYDVSASVEETPTEAWTAKGTNVGEYPVGIAAGDFKNTNETFTNVEFVVVDGTLKITPVTDEVIVTITGKTKTVTYDGKEHSVFGYDVTVSNALYNPKEDMQFNGIDADADR